MKPTNPKPLDNKTFNERLDEVLKKLDWRYDFSGDAVKENMADAADRNKFAEEAREAAKASLIALVDEVNTAVIGENYEFERSESSYLPNTYIHLKAKNELRDTQRYTAKDIIHGK